MLLGILAAVLLLITGGILFFGRRNPERVEKVIDKILRTLHIDGAINKAREAFGREGDESGSKKDQSKQGQQKKDKKAGENAPRNIRATLSSIATFMVFVFFAMPRGILARPETSSKKLAQGRWNWLSKMYDFLLTKDVEVDNKVVRFSAQAIWFPLAVLRAVANRFPVFIGTDKWGTDEKIRVFYPMVRSPKSPRGEWKPIKPLHFEWTDLVKLGLFIFMIAVSALSLISKSFSWNTITALMTAMAIVAGVHTFDKIHSRNEMRLYMAGIIAGIVALQVNILGAWGDGGILVGDVSQTVWIAGIYLGFSALFAVYLLVYQPIRFMRAGGAKMNVTRTQMMMAAMSQATEKSEEKSSGRKLGLPKIPFGRKSEDPKPDEKPKDEQPKDDGGEKREEKKADSQEVKESPAVTRDDDYEEDEEYDDDYDEDEDDETYGGKVREYDAPPRPVPAGNSPFSQQQNAFSRPPQNQQFGGNKDRH